MKNISKDMCLTERVLRYQQTGKNYSELIGEIYKFTYKYLRKVKRLPREQYNDFFFFLLPMLKKITENFRYQGIIFEHYLEYILKLRMNNYLRKKQKIEQKWKILKNISFWENYYHKTGIMEKAHTIDPRIAAIFQINNQGYIQDPACRKRFLLYALKRARELDQDDVVIIAQYTRYDKNWLTTIIEKLKKGLNKKEIRYNTLVEKRNRAFFYLNIIEEKLSKTIEPEKKIKLQKQLQNLRKILYNAVHEISRIPFSPTHKEIARVLGIPKGSIDTSMHRLKNLLKGIYSNNKSERYA